MKSHPQLPSSSSCPPPTSPLLDVVDELSITHVWADNLRAAFEKIMWMVDQYNYIAMDTEFPGIVCRPITTNKSATDYHYQTLKLNVDCMHLIQLGLTLISPSGLINRSSSSCHVFQFHFSFSLANDIYAHDAVELLNKHGTDFAKHEREGIDLSEFAELFITSGLIMNDDVRWLTFHSAFDFAYLLNIVTSSPLPTSESEFFASLQLFFPCFYDIKMMLKSYAASTSQPATFAQGGLAKWCDALHIKRVSSASSAAAAAAAASAASAPSSAAAGAAASGNAFSSGSNAVAIACLFIKLRDRYFSELKPSESKQDMSDDNENEASEADEDEQAAAEYEEKYMNLFYGLSPLSNTLLKTCRDKERALLTNDDDDDDTLSIASTTSVSTTASSSTASATPAKKERTKYDRSPVPNFMPQ